MASRKREQAKRVRAAFAALLEPMAWMRKNPRRAMQAPSTTLERLRTGAEAHVRRMGADGWMAMLREMFDAVPVVAVDNLVELAKADIAKKRAALGTDELGADALALYDQADANGPLSPWYAVAVPPPFKAVETLTLIGHLDGLGAKRGERRALALIAAVPKLATVYELHLRMVWMLTFLAEGEWPSPPPNAFGAWVKQTAERSGKFQLVDAQMGHMRNAVQHHAASYRPSSKDIQFRDVPARWSLELTPDLLEEWLTLTWKATTSIRERLQHIAFTDRLLRSGMLEAWADIRGALHGDAAATAALEQRDIDGAERRILFRAGAPPDPKYLWFFPGALEQKETASGS
jgi:hypothetical protein